MRCGMCRHMWEINDISLGNNKYAGGMNIRWDIRWDNEM